METTYYGTFMQKQATKARYVKIIVDQGLVSGASGSGSGNALAHGAMLDHFGTKFAFVYNEEQFLPQIEEYGLTELCTIRAIDHGYGSIEYVWTDAVAEE